MAGTVALALVVTPAFGWLAENLYDERAASAAALAEADDALRDEMIELGFTPTSPAHAGAQRLSNTHRIEILSARSPFSLPLANGVVSGSPPSPAESAAIAIVVEELSRYPRAFVERARLSRVVLCSALTEAETPIPSLPNFHRTLLLDVDAGPAFLRRLIHHEVFHFLDYADDDQVQRDPEWEKLNDRWFVYGSGGRFERDPRSSARGSASLPGFVTRYAQSALEEDKAETFAFLMVDPGWLEARAEQDAVLGRKLAAVRRQIERLGLALPGR